MIDYTLFAADAVDAETADFNAQLEAALVRVTEDISRMKSGAGI